MEIYNGTYCVYIHTNKIDYKKYAGITKYGNAPNKRWQNGKAYLLNKHFTQAIRKYGWDNFEHEIIASNLTEEEAKRFESILIDKLDLMNPDKGYNLNSGGETMNHSEQTKRKMSKSHSKAVCQYNTEGDFVKKWGSATSAGQALGIDAHWIAQCCKNNACTSAGFVWRYENDPFYLKDDPHFTKVYQFNLNGELIKEWRSISLASKETNINPGLISHCCNGLSKTAGGFIWSRENYCVPVYKVGPACKAVVQYSLDDMKIKIWPSITFVSKELKIHPMCISNCCNNKGHTAGGFKWRFATEEETLSLYVNAADIK